jgi:hypothetical protein
VSQRRLRDLHKMLADQTEAQLAQIVGGARAWLFEVVPGKVAWCVCVDLVVLASDGNLEDLCSLGRQPRGPLLAGRLRGAG